MNRLRGLAARTWLQAALTALATLALTLVVHRIWRADLAVPFTYSDDGQQYLMLAKGVHEHGWLLENGNLGAPFGLLMYDWAEGGWLIMAAYRLLDTLIADWVVSFNLLYLLGYPLIALTALWALLRLGIAPALSMALAILYAISPYHLDRGQNHYFLALYYGLPPILSYAVTIAGGRPAFALRRRGLDRRRWLIGVGGALLAAALAGIMQVYYIAFVGLVLLAAIAFGWLRARRLDVVVSGLVLCVVVGAAAVVQYAPMLAFRAAHGTNQDVAQRYLGEVENYPLKPMDLLLPVPGHPIRPLAELRTRYTQFAARGQPGLALGAVGAAGLLLVLGALVAAAARRRPGSISQRLAPAGWLATFALAIGVLGGGATLIGFILGPWLRTWDRIAIVVAFFALVGLGLALTRLRRRLSRRWRGAALAVVALLLLGGGLLDGASSPAQVRPYSEIGERWSNDARFVAAIEQQLPAQAMVYQLPYVTFPETNFASLKSIDLVRLYLHSTDLRWSAGYMRGREPGWQAVQAGPLPELLVLLRTLGFSGLTVDRLGYVDPETGVDTSPALLAELGAALGEPTARSDDGRLTFFRLPTAEPPGSPAARDALDPVRMRWASGFDLMAMRNGQVVHQARAVASIELRNARPEARPVVAAFELQPLADRPLQVELHWPDGVIETIALGAEPIAHRRRFSLPAGRTELRLRVPNAPPRGFAFTLADLAVVDESLAHLLPPLPAGSVR